MMIFNNYFELLNETEFPIRSRVKVSKENNFIEVSAPGKTKEDFSINVEEDRISISLKDGLYKEVFSLTNTADKDNIKAVCDAGILTVTVPFKESAKPREILID